MLISKLYFVVLLYLANWPIINRIKKKLENSEIDHRQNWNEHLHILERPGQNWSTHISNFNDILRKICGDPIISMLKISKDDYLRNSYPEWGISNIMIFFGAFYITFDTNRPSSRISPTDMRYIHSMSAGGYADSGHWMARQTGSELASPPHHSR